MEVKAFARKTCSILNMAHFLLTVLVACVTAGLSSAGDQRLPNAPKYKRATELYRLALDVLYSVTPLEVDLPTDTDPRVHYGLLEATLLNLVDAVVLKNQTVNQAYRESVRKGVLDGWTKPKAVGAEVRRRLENVAVNVAPVLELVVKYCALDNHDVQTRLSLGETCDFKVQIQVEKEMHKYLYSSRLLLLLGNLSETYLQRPYVKEAFRYEVLTVLLNEGRRTLVPLVRVLVDVYNYLHLYKSPVSRNA